MESQPRPRVLVIEDEELVATFIARVLERQCDVVTVGTGGEALARVASERPGFAAVLCDLLLPDMTGREVFTALLATAPALAARTVLMTGGVLDPELSEFIESLAHPPLRKPIDIRRLRATIEAFVASPGADLPSGSRPA